MYMLNQVQETWKFPELALQILQKLDDLLNERPYTVFLKVKELYSYLVISQIYSLHKCNVT